MTSLLQVRNLEQRFELDRSPAEARPLGGGAVRKSRVVHAVNDISST